MGQDQIALAAGESWAADFHLVSASCHDCADEHESLAHEILTLIASARADVEHTQSCQKQLHTILPTDNFEPAKVDMRNAEFSFHDLHDALVTLYQGHMHIASLIRGHETTVLDNFSKAQ